MQKDQMDQGLNFKKRARRRLVGAIALVLLMIIVLPMLLEDRENTPSQEEIAIVMPNQQTLDLPASTVLNPEASAVEEAVLAENSIDVDSAVSEVVEVELPKVKSEPKLKPKPKEAVAPKKASAKVKEKPKETVKPKPAASDKFYVQIGVFSDIANVEKLKVKLEELGYQSLTEKVTSDSGVKTRLRTEAFDGRNEAAIALENIKDQGLTGMVVNQK